MLYKTAFNVRAGADICLGDLGCAGGVAVFSSTGFAGCVKTAVADFGAGYKWGGSLDIMFTGCDVGPYETKVGARARAGARRRCASRAACRRASSRSGARARRRT